jgi:hypothetical protein
VEIIAYIDRVPETSEPEFGRLSTAFKGVWDSRLQYTGDFESLSEALAAIEVAYPAVEPVEGSFLVSTHESGIPRDISGKDCGKAEGGGYVISPAASRRPDR